MEEDHFAVWKLLAPADRHALSGEGVPTTVDRYGFQNAQNDRHYVTGSQAAIQVAILPRTASISALFHPKIGQIPARPAQKNHPVAAGFGIADMKVWR